jgi:hypothetical protein
MLTELSRPNSIRFINGSAFVSCDLAFISFLPSWTAFVCWDDMLEDVSGRELIHYFGNCQKIEISNSVEVIQSDCFANCQLVEHVTFALGSRLQVIEDSAFQGSGLKVIEIPRSVKIPGRCCFAGCQFLVSVRFTSGSMVEGISYSAFIEAKVEMIVIPVLVKGIGRFAFWFCSQLKSVIFEGNISYPSSDREI